MSSQVDTIHRSPIVLTLIVLPLHALAVTRSWAKTIARVALPSFIFLLTWHPTWGATADTTFQDRHADELYPVVIIQNDLASLRSGPGQEYPILAQVAQETQFRISGRSLDGRWVQLCCHNGAVGWLEAGEVYSVRVETPALLAEPTPLPTPTPSPAIFYHWKTSYFANPELAGAPHAVEDVANLNLDWSDRAPQAGLPADGFSVRFERTLPLQSGYYRLWLQADDGVRLFINEVAVLNEWHGATGNTYAIERLLTGTTTVRLEYFEASGAAFVRFGYEFMGNGGDWEATYFGPALQGAAWLVQSEPWIGGFPLARTQPLGIVSDAPTWSARWRGHFAFVPGNYIFHARAKGSVRVYLNEYLVLDGWYSGSKELANSFAGVGGETHTIVVEYASDQTESGVEVWWERQ